MSGPSSLARGVRGGRCILRLVMIFMVGSLLLVGPAALSQQNQDPDGFDRDAVMAMAKLYNDKRPLEQIRKDNALIRAAGNGDVRAVRTALKAGAALDSYYIDGFAAFGSDGSGSTALMWAVEGGHMEVVKLLIDEKADLNLTCINLVYGGETALYTAVKRNKEAIVDLLVKAGTRAIRNKSG